MQKYTTIKGLSQIRRLPRLGKIRLGIKVKNAQGKEYPKETPYFVVPDEIAKFYGDKPTELDVFLPVDDQETVFPQSYVYYGSSRGLKCKGNGEIATRALTFEKEQHGETPTKDDIGELIDVPCPCHLAEEGKCKQTGFLQVILPKISLGGCWQLGTSSYNSIVDINSALDYVRAMVGRVAMVPLKLKRVPTTTHYQEKTQIHYTLRLELEADIATINFLRENTHKVLEGPKLLLPAPEMNNPALDDSATVIEAEDEPEAPTAASIAAPATVAAQAQTAQPAAALPASAAAVAEQPAATDHEAQPELQLLSILSGATTIQEVNDVLLKMSKLSDGNAKLRVNREAAKAAKRVAGKAN